MDRGTVQEYTVRQGVQECQRQTHSQTRPGSADGKEPSRFQPAAELRAQTTPVDKYTEYRAAPLSESCKLPLSEYVLLLTHTSRCTTSSSKDVCTRERVIRIFGTSQCV